MRVRFAIFVSFCVAANLPAQADATLDSILARLNSMEQQNQRLAEEVRALRQELAFLKAAPPDAAPLEERIAVQEPAPKNSLRPK